jgi:hypothetical protein
VDRRVDRATNEPAGQLNGLPQTGIFALGTGSHADLELARIAGVPAADAAARVAALREPRTTISGVNLGPIGAEVAAGAAKHHPIPLDRLGRGALGRLRGQEVRDGGAKARPAGRRVKCPCVGGDKIRCPFVRGVRCPSHRRGPPPEVRDSSKERNMCRRPRQRPQRVVVPAWPRPSAPSLSGRRPGSVFRDVRCPFRRLVRCPCAERDRSSARSAIASARAESGSRR